MVSSLYKQIFPTIVVFVCMIMFLPLIARADTFGLSSISGATNGSGGRPYCSVYVAPANGTVTSISSYNSYAAGGGSWQGGIYDSNGAASTGPYNYAGTLLGHATADTAIPTAAAWSTSTMATGIPITSGHAYWLCFYMNVNSAVYYYTNSGVNDTWEYTNGIYTSYPTWSDPSPSKNASSARAMTIYATYTPLISKKVSINRPPNYLTTNTGLVAYWTFDGKDTPWTSSTAATTLDKSGNGKTGTLTSMNQATAPVVGRIGQGLLFNGTTNYISMPSISNVESVSFWIKPNTTTQSIMDFNGTQTINISSGTLGASGWSSPTIYIDGLATTTLSNTNWHFVTVTTASTFTASAMNVGKISSSFFKGTLDDVRIYNRALSATEISLLYRAGTAMINTTSDTGNLASGLVGHWTFDGKNTHWTSSTAGTTDDVSGNGNTGTLTNMNQATSPVVGKLGQGLKFNGSTSYISVSNTITTRTVSFWIKPTSNTASMINLAAGTYVTASAGTITATGFTSPTIYVNGTTGTTLKANVWNQIVVTDTANTSANAITVGKANGDILAAR